MNSDFHYSDVKLPLINVVLYITYRKIVQTNCANYVLLKSPGFTVLFGHWPGMASDLLMIHTRKILRAKKLHIVISEI